MSTPDKLSQAGPRPSFVVSFFNDVPGFRAGWKEKRGSQGDFLGERFWSLRDDTGLKVAGSVASLMVGVTVQYPEFAGIGSTVAGDEFDESGASHELSYLALYTTPFRRFLNPDRTAEYFIEAVNNQLASLDSFYRLPY